MEETLQILLAEDNPADVFLVEEALSLANLSFRIVKATDGEKAAQILEEASEVRSTLDLILLDLNLPKVSGHELLAQVRSSEHLRSTPVIILTSSDSPQDRSKTTSLGISYYFRKPTDLNDFLRLGNIVQSIYRDLQNTSGR